MPMTAAEALPIAITVTTISHPSRIASASCDTSSGEQLQGVLPHLQNFVGIRQKRR
jgi:hypothetical protein